MAKRRPEVKIELKDIIVVPAPDAQQRQQRIFRIIMADLDTKAVQDKADTETPRW